MPRRYDNNSSVYQRVADKVVLSASASQVPVEHLYMRVPGGQDMHVCGHALPS